MSHDIIQIWRDRGVRITKLRQAMVEVLTKTMRPVSVAQIIETLGKKRVTANKTSIYRELQFLQEQDLVRAVHISPKEISYEWDGEHHHHLVCRNCETVEELELGEKLETAIDAFEKKLSGRLKFAGISHTLEFFGLCRKCR